MKNVAIASLLGLALALPAVADDKQQKSGDAAAGAAQPSAMADGEIRKVDKDAQKITIRHGPMPSLDMPQPMTMVYRVKDPAMLDKVKAGDKVKFEAENIAGAFTITKIEPAR
jgi:Cu(I)/Ag(I) efflux system periplasmic protein CusF